MPKKKDEKWGWKNPPVSKREALRLAIYGPHTGKEMTWALVLHEAASREHDRANPDCAENISRTDILLRQRKTPEYKQACDALERQFPGVEVLPDDEEDKFWQRIVAGVVREMSEAVLAGDRAPFERLAAAVDYLRVSSFLAGGNWADPLAAQIVTWAGGLHGGIFNVPKFIKDTGCRSERKTVKKRALALGFQVPRDPGGRPRKAENLGH